MPNYEIRIPLGNANLVIHFDSAEELSERLKDFDFNAVRHVIQEKFADAVAVQARQIKPALIGICAFTPDGGLEFLKPPREMLEALALALYAFDPQPVSVGDIGKFASVRNPVAYLGNLRYRDYFEKMGRGSYRLSHRGKLWVVNDIIPRMSEKQKEEIRREPGTTPI